MNFDSVVVSLEDRRRAAALEQRADEERDGRSDRMHRVIRATGHGWVEIQADYLGHLLDRIESESRWSGG